MESTRGHPRTCLNTWQELAAGDDGGASDGGFSCNKESSDVSEGGKAEAGWDAGTSNKDASDRNAAADCDDVDYNASSCLQISANSAKPARPLSAAGRTAPNIGPVSARALRAVLRTVACDAEATVGSAPAAGKALRAPSPPGVAIASGFWVKNWASEDKLPCHLIGVWAATPVEVFRIKVYEATRVPASVQRLCFGIVQLEDGRTLADYSIPMRSTLDLKLRLCGGAVVSCLYVLRSPGERAWDNATRYAGETSDYVALAAALLTKAGLQQGLQVLVGYPAGCDTIWEPLRECTAALPPEPVKLLIERQPIAPAAGDGLLHVWDAVKAACPNLEWDRVQEAACKETPTSSRSTHGRTYGICNEWDFDEALGETIAALKDSRARVRPPSTAPIAPAGNEIGVCMALSSHIHPVVHESVLAIGVDARFGQGEGRIEDSRVDLKIYAGPVDKIIGIKEVKCFWKLKLAAGKTLAQAANDEERHAMHAVQQLFGDLLCSERGVGLLTTFNASWLIMRESTSSTDLKVSRTFPPDELKLLLAHAMRVINGTDTMLDELPTSQTMDHGDSDDALDDGARDISSRDLDYHPPGRQGASGSATQQGSQQQGGQQHGGQQQRGCQQHGVSSNVTVSSTAASSNAAASNSAAQQGSQQQGGHKCSMWLEKGLQVWPISSLQHGALIGSGETSLVYSARVHGCPAVVKVFVATRAGQAQMLEELRMYKAVQQLQGSVLPTVLASGLIDHTFAPFIALSDEGTSLAAFGRVTSETGAAALAALQQLHLHGLLHGDVRLENVVISLTTSCVKLIDLGRAVAGASRQACEAELTQLHHLLAMAVSAE